LAAVRHRAAGLELERVGGLEETWGGLCVSCPGVEWHCGGAGQGEDVFFLSLTSRSREVNAVNLFVLTATCFFGSGIIFLEICAQMVSTEAQLGGHV